MSWWSKLFACPVEEQPEADSEDIDRVAMRLVHRMDCQTRIGDSVEQCDRILARITEIRQQYAAQEPRVLRKAIMRWLDYYERKAQEDRKYRVDRKRQDELARRLGVPQ